MVCNGWKRPEPPRAYRAYKAGAKQVVPMRFARRRGRPETMLTVCARAIRPEAVLSGAEARRPMNFLWHSSSYAPSGNKTHLSGTRLFQNSQNQFSSDWLAEAKSVLRTCTLPPVGCPAWSIGLRCPLRRRLPVLVGRAFSSLPLWDSFGSLAAGECGCIA